MTTEAKFAEAYNTVAEMMERAKPSPQKAAIELLLDSVMVFVEELKTTPAVVGVQQAPTSGAGAAKQYHTTHNGHRYEVQAEQSVANQQNIYQQNYTTHQYIYHEPQGMYRDLWVLPGQLSIDMAAVEYYDTTASQLHLRSGKVIDIKPHQQQRLLSWYYMKGLLRPPRPSTPLGDRGSREAGGVPHEGQVPERSRRPNDPAKSAEIIAQIKSELRTMPRNR